MSFYHNTNYVLEVVSIKRSKTTREKEVGIAKWRHEKKGEFEGEVHKKQKTFETYTHLSLKWKIARDYDNPKSSFDVSVWWWWGEGGFAKEVEKTRGYYNDRQY
jgi:hypothetical protein